MMGSGSKITQVARSLAQAWGSGGREGALPSVRFESILALAVLRKFNGDMTLNLPGRRLALGPVVPAIGQAKPGGDPWR